ncbi:hypothetical protein JK359_35450 [Streptomyces actinomycinicus]|uniref:Uncharacterized protein n=1 Tax=Streptomyces actinomycinicus TaxID=1695166 RepID=A0A937JQZ0_9ACTN|nr:hypothetical protein [Streptomyces actinomycinicus]MBL1087205.1 hypothetical protein [Streptomyces actinomycinicus]
MANLKVSSKVRADYDGDLAALRSDCARMVPHWAVPEHAEPRPVPPSLIHGVKVPARSARLLDAMSDYGD